MVGYAYAVLFRKRPAYRYTAKHSIYVHHAHLGRGVGRLLLQELVDVCAAAGFRQMIGYIDADNAPSLALHEKFGYVSELQFILDGSLSLQRFLLWGVPSSLLVMGCVFLEKKQVFTRVWNNKWIRLTGDASYSIYLVHIIVFSMLSQVYKRIKWHALPDVSIFLQLALAIAAGIAFYRWVEKPLLQRLRRKRLKPALAAAPGTINPL